MPGIAYALERLVTVAGFAADDDPNVTTPPLAQILQVSDEVPGAADDNAVRSHALYATYEDAGGNYVAGGTWSFQTYEKDENVAGLPKPRWSALRAEAGAPNAQKFYTRADDNSKLFVRVTALDPPGGATKLRIRATGEV